MRRVPSSLKRGRRRPAGPAFYLLLAILAMELLVSFLLLCTLRCRGGRGKSEENGEGGEPVDQVVIGLTMKANAARRSRRRERRRDKILM